MGNVGNELDMCTVKSRNSQHTPSQRMHSAQTRTPMAGYVERWEHHPLKQELNGHKPPSPIALPRIALR